MAAEFNLLTPRKTLFLGESGSWLQIRKNPIRVRRLSRTVDTSRLPFPPVRRANGDVYCVRRRHASLSGSLPLTEAPVRAKRKIPLALTERGTHLRSRRIVASAEWCRIRKGEATSRSVTWTSPVLKDVLSST